MRALSLTFALLAAALAAAPSAHAQASEAIPDKPPLAAALQSCATSPLPAERIAVFTASMPALANATRMSMRFDLKRLRPGARHWRRIIAPTFGVWERSLPNRAGFVFRKRIDGLQVPASYRVTIRFRWQDDGGEVVRRETRTTGLCEQPDLRPDLVPEAVSAILDLPGLALYRVKLRNTGRAPAGPFSVRVGSATVEVAQLAAGRRMTALVLGPACAFGTRLLVRVDADGRVDEADERGNLLRGVCPLLTA